MTIAPPKLSPMSWAALALGGAALVVVALQGSKLVRAVLMPSAGVGDVRKAVEEQAQRHAAAFDPHMAQIRGRQLFLMPAPAPVAEVEEPVDEPITEPRVPTVYAGPSVVAMINDAVWFSNGARIAKGEMDGDIKVVDIDPPWSAQVEWRGSEFTVKLFDRDAVILPVAERADARRTPVVAAPELSPAPIRPKAPEAPATAAPAAPANGTPQTAPASGGDPPPPPPDQGEPAPPEPMPQEPSDGDPNQSDGGSGTPGESPGEPPPESARVQTTPTK